ncbi:hypothetical protein HaLaN_30076 [Haematococcus lacustris]|uniref:Uncharacterized protein n=1 Tax=Haematococcus lacustris TaxID=44745 RepID=A0A6A0AER4_HAELA|nr:hypothetical protein HaLaN_30076 [Haematococcus lacustris]
MAREYYFKYNFRGLGNQKGDYGGEDNWSTNTLAAVVEAIREPGMSNFNYLALCVGAQDVASMINDAFKASSSLLSAACHDATGFHSSFSSPGLITGVRHMHVRVIRPDGSPNFLADVFRTAKKRMLKPKQALAETLTLKIVNNAKGAKPSMPELLGQFGAMHLGGGRRTRGQLG